MMLTKVVRTRLAKRKYSLNKEYVHDDFILN